MIAQRDVDVSVTYGIGGSCEAVFPRESLNGVSVGNVIERVARMPQSNTSAARTAVVLQGVLKGDRTLDVEVLDHPDDDLNPGKPVKLDSVLLDPAASDPSEDQTQDISLRVSEPYRGGTAC